MRKTMGVNAHSKQVLSYKENEEEAEKDDEEEAEEG